MFRRTIPLCLQFFGESETQCATDWQVSGRFLPSPSITTQRNTKKMAPETDAIFLKRNAQKT
ncbi:hypothetical protein BJI49_06235 [Acetobacter pasteurianus]|nr:hypothetical protein BJI49_06235 [Acetobacter pasteurianus]BAU37139.1 hypothetical protein APT_00057 [Acetobacter pasteurianus NBRC 101655]GAB30586.1 hypothetical protein APS_1188 [Acetobacter pasteurianus subsp. pasteurianus LMG 1262 = NBRC 106471]GLH30560.1 hypothetical protein WSS15_32100 [Acetobacter pasteurianus]CCT59624.1 hypothetical protein APA386B_1546 [Acetobacter pasteurianus 386B]